MNDWMRGDDADPAGNAGDRPDGQDRAPDGNQRGPDSILNEAEVEPRRAAAQGDDPRTAADQDHDKAMSAAQQDSERALAAAGQDSARMEAGPQPGPATRPPETPNDQYPATPTETQPMTDLQLARLEHELDRPAAADGGTPAGRPPGDGGNPPAGSRPGSESPSHPTDADAQGPLVQPEQPSEPLLREESAQQDVEGFLTDPERLAPAIRLGVLAADAGGAKGLDVDADQAAWLAQPTIESWKALFGDERK